MSASFPIIIILNVLIGVSSGDHVLIVPENSTGTHPPTIAFPTPIPVTSSVSKIIGNDTKSLIDNEDMLIANETLTVNETLINSTTTTKSDEIIFGDYREQFGLYETTSNPEESTTAEAEQTPPVTEQTPPVTEVTTEQTEATTEQTEATTEVTTEVTTEITTEVTTETTTFVPETTTIQVNVGTSFPKKGQPGTASVSTAVPYPYSTTRGYWRVSEPVPVPTRPGKYKKNNYCPQLRTMVNDMNRIEMLMSDVQNKKLISGANDGVNEFELELIFSQYLNIVSEINSL